MFNGKPSVPCGEWLFFADIGRIGIGGRPHFNAIQNIHIAVQGFGTCYPHTRAIVQKLGAGFFGVFFNRAVRKSFGGGGLGDWHSGVQNARKGRFLVGRMGKWAK